MKVLIVDDEIPSVDGTMKLIDWERIGFSERFAAYDIQSAIGILRNTPADLLLCDIEMPGGTGLELVRWMRQHAMETQILLLTAHENFRYAKEAMELGCMDYLLKPVTPEELEHYVEKAVDIIDDQKQLDELQSYGGYWIENKTELTERFWLNLLHGELDAGDEGTRKKAGELQLTDLLQRPLEIFVIDLNQKCKVDKQRLIEIKRQLLPWFSEQYAAVLQDEGNVVILADAGQGVSDGVLPKLKQWLERWKQRSAPAIYYEQGCLPEELKTVYHELCEQKRNNVTGKSGIFPRCSQVFKTQVPWPNYRIWEQLLEKEVLSDLCREILYYKQQIMVYPLTVQFMVQFHHDCLQMVYSVLNAKGIQAHRLFEEEQSIHGPELEIKTIDDLFDWALYTARRAVELCGMASSESVMEKVERFIKNHISEELTRDRIADHVFLNPDYLSRLVKHATGFPISEYIQRERVIQAQTLLLSTDMPVSRIALQVGYQHFSQFGKIFKKYTQTSPAKYRKMHRQAKERP